MTPGLARGSPDYRRLRLAMLFAGFSTFSLLIRQRFPSLNP